MNMTSASEAIAKQAPQLPIVGWGLWVAWNLAAFTGLGWFEETADSWRIFQFVNVHMAASLATLIVFFVFSKKVAAFLRKPAGPLAGGAAASLGAVLVVLASPLLFKNGVMFFIGCVLAGSGTTFLFARGAAWLGALPPRISFMRICQAVMVGAAAYCMLAIAPREAMRVLFCLLPLCSGALLALRAYTKIEGNVLAEVGKATNRYRNFLIAVFVFSLAAQFLKGGAYPLESAQSHLGFDISTLIIFATAAVSFLACAASTKEFGFGRMYQPATLVLIALLVVVPLTGEAVPKFLGTALCIAAQYAFNLLVWGMAAYAVFQVRGNALRVFCSANAALTAGSLAGNLITYLLTSLGISGANFLAMCLLVALAAVVVAIFVFPENKLEEMLLPVDESAFENHAGEDRFAPWKEACTALSEEHGLSERESEVFALLARGKTNQQVADMLVISPYTVRAHTRSIYSKLDVHSRGELSDLVRARVDAGR